MANNRGAKLQVDHNHYLKTKRCKRNNKLFLIPFGPFGITVIVLTIKYYQLLKISID